jgi:hypothetical protein
MIFFPRLKYIEESLRKINTRVGFLSFLIALVIQVCFVVPAIPGEILRYQVVTGGGENAYLVDTTTGFTWILTYRTLPTGREPVAIPFKFIGITPQGQSNFLTESAPVFSDQTKDTK